MRKVERTKSIASHPQRLCVALPEAECPRALQLACDGRNICAGPTESVEQGKAVAAAAGHVQTAEDLTCTTVQITAGAQTSNET